MPTPQGHRYAPTAPVSFSARAPVELPRRRRQRGPGADPQPGGRVATAALALARPPEAGGTETLRRERPWLPLSIAAFVAAAALLDGVYADRQALNVARETDAADLRLMSLSTAWRPIPVDAAPTVAAPAPVAAPEQAAPAAPPGARPSVAAAAPMAPPPPAAAGKAATGTPGDGAAGQEPPLPVARDGAGGPDAVELQTPPHVAPAIDMPAGGPTRRPPPQSRPEPDGAAAPTEVAPAMPAGLASAAPAGAAIVEVPAAPPLATLEPAAPAAASATASAEPTTRADGRAAAALPQQGQPPAKPTGPAKRKGSDRAASPGRQPPGGAATNAAGSTRPVSVYDLTRTAP